MIKSKTSVYKCENNILGGTHMAFTSVVVALRAFIFCNCIIIYQILFYSIPILNGLILLDNFDIIITLVTQ